jgi:hypothetical protein
LGCRLPSDTDCNAEGPDGRQMIVIDQGFK